METPATTLPDATVEAERASVIVNPHIRELVDTRAILNDQTRPVPFTAYNKSNA